MYLEKAVCVNVFQDWFIFFTVVFFEIGISAESYFLISSFEFAFDKSSTDE